MYEILYINYTVHNQPYKKMVSPGVYHLKILNLLILTILGHFDSVYCD